MKFEIKHRFNGSVLFAMECDSLKVCVEAAVKSRANLAGANLARANLADAYLADANLARANLAGANLAGANWTNGAAITRAPLQLFGLDYPVTIVDAHMQIGCELHSLAEWEAFDDERISRMDGKRARRFWDAHRDTLLALARADGRSFE